MRTSAQTQENRSSSPRSSAVIVRGSSVKIPSSRPISSPKALHDRAKSQRNKTCTLHINEQTDGVIKCLNNIKKRESENKPHRRGKVGSIMRTIGSTATVVFVKQSYVRAPVKSVRDSPIVPAVSAW